MKLPNAPLLEVVFELRWALEGPKNVPIQLQHDPAFPLLAYEFTEKAKSHGFNVRREMAVSPTGPLGHSIQYRFYKNDESPFPIWQIGPGIFAYNESTEYEWESFKSSLRKAAQVLLSSYPKTKASQIRPVHMELRYIDTYTSEMLGHTDMAKFLDNDVNLMLKPNDFFSLDYFVGPFDGRVEIVRKLSRDNESSFRLEIGTGEANKKPVVLVVSKVVKQSDDMKLGSNSRSIISNLIRWADESHELTHRFFWNFVGEALMKKFSE